MKQTAASTHWRHWLPFIVAVLAVYVFLPQLKIFHASLYSLRTVNGAYVSIALVAVAASFICSALSYLCLSYRPIAFGRTLVVELAANFINRLLPAGIGGIGANYRYLLKQKHRPAQAASVVAVNNSLGVIGNTVLVAVLVVTSHERLTPGRITALHIYIAIGCLLVAASLIVIPRVRKRITALMTAFYAQLLQFRRRPLSLFLALASQMLLTLSMVTAFWASTHAVHVALGFVTALLIFSVGFGIGNAAPTPGGLGGIEAGLVAGLLAYHVASAPALAAVLLFRICSYWWPLLISGPLFVYAARRHYF